MKKEIKFDKDGEVLPPNRDVSQRPNSFVHETTEEERRIKEKQAQEYNKNRGVKPELDEQNKNTTNWLKARRNKLQTNL